MVKRRDEAIKEFDAKVSKLEREYKEVKRENTRLKDYVYILGIAFVVLAIACFFVLRLTGNVVWEDYSLVITGVAHWKMNDNTNVNFNITDSLNGHACALQGGTPGFLTKIGKINNATYSGYGGTYNCIGGTYQAAYCNGSMDVYCNQWDGQSFANCFGLSGNLCFMDDEGYGNDCYPNPNCNARADSFNCSQASTAGCNWVDALDCSSLETEEDCNAVGSPCSWSLTGESYDYAVCDNSTVWNTVPFTFSFWTMGTGHGGHWMGSGDNAANEWRIEGNGNPYVVMSNTICVQSNNIFNDGAWHMATVTVNENGRWRWYTDGVLRDESICDIPDSGTGSVFKFWRVGEDPAVGFTLDDVRFYSGEMNADQIKQIYNNGTGTEEEFDFSSGALNVSINTLFVGEKHYSFIDFENSLVGWWRGEGNALDSSGNGYTGTWSGNENYSEGVYNGSFLFNGSNYIDVGNLNTKREYTISMMVNADSLSNTWAALFTQRNSCTNANMHLYAKDAFDCSGNISSSVTTTSGFYQICGVNALPTNEWHLITTTYNGHNLSLYYDGVLDTSINAYGDLIQTGVTGKIGDDSCGNYFYGKIDDVLFFDRALSSNEILALNASSNLYSKKFIVPSYTDSSVDSPILHYKLNDNDETNFVLDSSPNSYNGTGSTGNNAMATTGKINGGFNMSGNRYFDTGYTFASLENYSVGIWFNPASIGTVDGVFSNGASGSNHNMYFASYHVSFNGMYYAWFNGTNGEQSFDTGITPTIGVWHHMMVTKSGTLMSMYYDGKLIATKTTTETLATPTHNLWIGQEGYNNYFNGKIDDFRLYDYGLSAGAVANIYNRSRGSEAETFGNYEYQINVHALNASGDNYVNSTSADIPGVGNTDSVSLFLRSGESDTTAPSISISYPSNTTYNSVVTALNYSASDETALSSCWYFNGTGNTTITCGTNWTGLSATQGSNTWIVYANDSSNNLNSSSVTFYVDSIAPSITVTSPQNITYNTNNITVNFTSSDANSISSRWFYNGTRNVSYSSPVTINLANGQYTFIFYSNDSVNNLNSTSQTFSVSADTTPPLISYTYGIPVNGDVDSSLFINTSLTESNLANVTYYLYNSTGLYNATTFNSAITSITFNAPAGNYSYQVNATDNSNNKNATALRNITILSGCESGACTEGNSCTISSDCYLNNDNCNGGICQFTNLTISANLYTLYDSNGNGKDLDINLTSNVTSPLLFLTGGKIIFNGRNGTDIGSGSAGGNAGLVNVTVLQLLNTTHAFFEGIGGYSTLSGSPGGNGGNLSLFFHGLIRKFSDFERELSDNAPVLAAGSSIESLEGNPGTTSYTRSLSCPRDADVNDDGIVTGDDSDDTAWRYNCANGSADATCVADVNDYIATSDINCDDNINVIELSREGFQWNRGII